MNDPRLNPLNVTEEIQDANSGLKFKLHQWIDEKGSFRSYIEPAFDIAIHNGVAAFFQKQ